MFQCKDCSSTFEEERYLYCHILHEADDGVETTCMYCEDTFTDKDELKTHIMDCHSYLDCPECDRSFYCRQGYRDHVYDMHMPGDLNQVYIHLDGMEPWETIHQLADRLEPTDEFLEYYEEVKCRCETFIENNTKYKKSRLMETGATAKGTAIGVAPFESDLDLVLFLDNYDVQSMDKFISDVDEILDKLKQHVEHGDMTWAHGLKLKRRNQCSLQFIVEFPLNGQFETCNIDLLPAVDVLHGRFTRNAREKIYRRMLRMSERERNYFNPSLSTLQLDYVSNVPGHLKTVMRILKMWGKTIRKEEKFRINSYFFELVVLHCWYEDDCLNNVDIVHYVRYVMEELCFCPILRIVWPNEYDFLDYRTEKEGPIVLDPANPFRDLAPCLKTAEIISRRAIDEMNN